MKTTRYQGERITFIRPAPKRKVLAEQGAKQILANLSRGPYPNQRHEDADRRMLGIYATMAR